MFHSPPPTDVGSPNPPLLEPSVLAATRSLSPIKWDLLIHSPSGPNIFTSTLSCNHPIRGSTFSLAHHPLSGSDTICNDPKDFPSNLPLRIFNS